jgi:C4-type Zn-finger protein
MKGLNMECPSCGYKELLKVFSYDKLPDKEVLYYECLRCRYMKQQVKTKCTKIQLKVLQNPAPKMTLDNEIFLYF